MSRARELAKVGGVQQRIAGFSSHVGMSTFLGMVHMEGHLQVDGNASVDGNLTVTGTTTFNGGTLNLGNAATDNVVFGGEVDSNIIPDDDGSFDLGSSSKEWKDLFIDGTAHIDTLDVDENAGIIGNLTLTGNADFNGDLDVDGTTNLDVVDIDGAVDMASNLVIAGNIDANGNLDVDGTTDLDTTNVVGTLTVTGDIAADNVTVNGNTVSTSSGNLTLDSSGGTVAVADNITVSGNGAVTGTFDVDGATTLDGLTVAEGASFSSTLGVSGTTTLSGQLDANGDVNLGNATSDTITATGRFDSDLLPSTDGARDLGSSTNEWQDLFIDGTAQIDSLVADTADINGGSIDGATIGSASATTAAFTTISASGNVDFNGDLDVDGTTNLDAVDIDGAVDMASSLTLAGNADFNGNLDVDGTTDLDATNIVGTLTVTGDIAADNVTVNGNTVSTSSGNLTLDSSGGTVAVADNITVSGNGSVTGTFDVDGATTLDGLTVAENATFSAAIDVDGHTNLDNVSVAGVSTFASGVTITGALDANGGASIDNVQVGVTNDNEIDTSSGNLVIDSAGGTVTVDDNLTVSGNLTVNGTTTTINSTTVAIDDKNFQVATGAADDSAADGAGLTVDSGDGDKTFNFEATGDNWGASENLNLASGKVYKINNSSILSNTTLGSSVVNSSLTTVGTITTGEWQGTAIANSSLANSTVSYGGIQISLGGSDATPAFDLSDAHSYPTSSLDGTITNSQLAGSIQGTKLENSGVTAGSYGGSTAIPILVVDAQGLVTSASTTAIDSTTIENGTASVAVASNGPITSTGNHDFTAGIDVTGNITVSGTVDGRDVAGDGSKLDGIESGATADQTAAEIRTLVGSASDSNVFTDALSAKLVGIETSATADQSASEILTLIKTVDGAGSGLDADTLDGISSASFLRSDTSDTFTGTLTVSGNIIPNANGTRDLGANGTRWANVYSSDLDLSNQAKGANSVDGTWGSYLIEEGEDHLFLTNRRSGKKYRFVLEEV